MDRPNIIRWNVSPNKRKTEWKSTKLLNEFHFMQILASAQVWRNKCKLRCSSAHLYSLLVCVCVCVFMFSAVCCDRIASSVRRRNVFLPVLFFIRISILLTHIMWTKINIYSYSTLHKCWETLHFFPAVFAYFRSTTITKLSQLPCFSHALLGFLLSRVHHLPVCFTRMIIELTFVHLSALF